MCLRTIRCGRFQRKDWTMSHRLYHRIQNVVELISPQLEIFDMASLLSNSEKCIHSTKPNIVPKYQPITCNPNLRLYKYTKGQWFGRHVDESNRIEFPSTTFSSTSKHNSPSKDSSLKDARTEITVLFYLSSCHGGATVFHLPRERKSSSTSIAFTPEEGAVLLHVHGDRCLEHEAEPVLEGVKYGEGFFVEYMNFVSFVDNLLTSPETLFSFIRFSILCSFPPTFHRMVNSTSYRCRLWNNWVKNIVECE